MRRRKNIIVRMSIWLVSTMIVISVGIGLLFEHRVINGARDMLYEETEIATRVITASIAAFVEDDNMLTDEEIRDFVMDVKPDKEYDISILDAAGNYIVAPKPDIATGSDALVLTSRVPEKDWTIVFTYPHHIFIDYLHLLRWRMALIGLVAIVLLLTTIVLIVQFVARPFVREQQHLVETKVSMERDIDIAGKIQQNFLPHNLVGAEALLLPAKNIGGDLYDVIVQDDTCFFCIGDVSGKGIPASMFMASSIMLFRHAVRDEHLSSPAAIMQAINRTIARENKDCMFVTMFIGALTKDGTLTYCNAGHCSPIVAGAFLPLAACMPIGVFEDAEFVEESLVPQGERVPTGEKGTYSIFLYTDGVTEAMNTHGECFGEKRLLDLFADATPTMAQVLAAVRTYAGAAEQSDDITMLRIDCQFPDTLIFDHISTRQNRTAEIVSEVLTKAASLHTAVPDSLRLIVEELVVNIARYSYPTDGEGDCDDRLWITVEYVDSAFVLTFRDHGVPFNPLSATEPDLSLSAEDRPVGGLGIFLVKQLSTDLSYTYSHRTNTLRLTLAG